MRKLKNKKKKNNNNSLITSSSENLSFSNDSNENSNKFLSDSSSENELDYLEFDKNLKWQPLYFETEFGKKTNRIKDKFLNFEI